MWMVLHQALVPAHWLFKFSGDFTTSCCKRKKLIKLRTLVLGSCRAATVPKSHRKTGHELNGADGVLHKLSAFNL